ncbi:hypothetical protein TeGR_g7436, partial [Tetraparma gracilis]
YTDETGVVVAADDEEGEKVIICLTDITNKEIRLRPSQVQESGEVSTGKSTLHGYELYDLVALSGGGTTNEVGVVTRVGREEFTTVNQNDQVRDVRPEELRGKKNSTSMRAVALDFQGNQIRVGDSVNVVSDGPHKNKSATIKHISRASLFLHSILMADNAGIFVMKARSVSLTAGSDSRQSLPEANASETPQVGQTPLHAGGLTPAHGGSTTPMHGGQYGDGEEEDGNVWLPGASGIDDQPTPSTDSWNVDQGGWANPAMTGTPSDPTFTPQGSSTPSSWGVPTPADSSVSASPGGSTLGGTPDSFAYNASGSSVGGSDGTPLSTPGGGGSELPAFAVPRACINLHSQGGDAEFVVVSELQGGMVTVEPAGGGAATQVMVGDISRAVVPDANDSVLVVKGGEVGNEGTLVCIDGSDAIFRDANGDFKIVDVADIAKVKASEAGGE